MNRKEELNRFQKKIGYQFKEPKLLQEALIHSSYSNENPDAPRCNERLEFLGDAVLELLVSDLLFRKYPNLPEGVLTKKRSQIVCEPSFAYIGKRLHIPEYLLLGKGEEATGGRERKSIIADAFEALCGAVYLDGGMKFLQEYLEIYLEEIIRQELEEEVAFVDYKSRLQELMHRMSAKPPEYRVVRELGPAHNKIFHVAVYINGEIAGRGQGKNKKAAEQSAAKIALEALKKK